jgi:hypothetical protein
MLAYVTTATFYSITEAGFRTLSPSWFFLLLAVVTASGITSGLFGGKKLIPEKATVYAARRRLAQFELARERNLR